MNPITATEFLPEYLTDAKYWWNRKTAEELAEPAETFFHELLSITQARKKLFQLISTTIPSMHGWCSVEKACALSSLVLARKPKTIVEIGVWGGRSLLPMAWAVKENGTGGVIGIDPYDAKVSAESEFGDNEQWWAEQDHGMIYRSFTSFIRNFKLEDIVTLAKVRSDEFKPVPCELLHIDGSHTEQAVRDAERYGPKVPLGGIVVCDDIMWVGGGVLRAIDALEEMGFTERFRFSEQNWNVLQKTK